MASTFKLQFLNLWPFTLFKSDELKRSNQLVRKLPIPEQTKQFVYALRDPDSNIIVYILAAQNLSKQSALDAEILIRTVQPNAVIAQIASSALAEIQIEEKNSRDNQENEIPTSATGVLKRCLTDKINKEHYDKCAGFQVLQEIFGIGFYGHFFAAKKAAEEVDSHFVFLESPYVSSYDPSQPSSSSGSSGNSNLDLSLQQSYLLPNNKAAPLVNSASKRFCLTDALQERTLKSLVPTIERLLPKTSEVDIKNDAYDPPPPFAQSVYPLLLDLYEIFSTTPGIKRALLSAQEMLSNINKGNSVDTLTLSNVYNFRIAVEGLRIAFNNAVHCPENAKPEGKVDFSELSTDEKCHALFAQALKSEAKKYEGSIVAIVEARSLTGLRKHWTTTIPLEIAHLANECFITHDYCNNDEISDDYEHNTGKRKLLADKPAVAVGAGATAVLGATSLSKIATYKVPTVLKFGLANMKRQAYVGLSKILGPTKILGPAKTSGAVMKVTASAEKIRAATHGVISYAERTSLLAIRTSFYGIMRRYNSTGSVRVAPWATFGLSVLACSGLVKYGDGIECAAESVPFVSTVASLGRGIKSLQRASEEVRMTSTEVIQEKLLALANSRKKK